MNNSDAQTIIALAALAAAADGNQSEAERANIAAAATRLGLPDDDPRLKPSTTGPGTVAALVSTLSSDEARLAAYDAAAAVCQADGPPNAAESAFLTELMRALGGVPGVTATNETLKAAAAVGTTSSDAPPSDVDAHILDQAMLAGACELLPHRLAAMGILPLQLRMVYTIGQRHGQQFDMSQAKDLIAVLGIGAAGHMMEGIVRSVLGGVGKGLLGGILGRATGAAAGVAVTFATTYALGHAAEQYYAQGRKLSAADLKALFARFQGEATTVFPRVEARIRDLANGTNLNSLLAGIRR